MELMTTLLKRLNIPLAKHKVVGPCTVIEYLGIILDTEKMEARLPQEKVIRICDFIKKFTFVVSVNFYSFWDILILPCE
jgi:hypothetical protein